MAARRVVGNIFGLAFLVIVVLGLLALPYVIFAGSTAGMLTLAVVLLGLTAFAGAFLISRGKRRRPAPQKRGASR